MSKLNSQLGRFLVVGLTTVAIDFTVYRILLALGLAVGIAKATSFIAGTIFAYFANRLWTFGVRRPGVDPAEVARFAAVYAVSLLANVTANGVALHLLPASQARLVLAFVAATGLSAAMNFLGMKFLVFRPGQGQDGAPQARENPVALSFSLVIPCYNEGQNLPHLLERCAAVTAARPGVEIVLVDNGSTDASPQILQELLPRYPGCRSVRVAVNKGYGFGVVSGLRAATGDILAWTHADLQTDPTDALTGLERFERAAAPETLFVKGRRYGRPLGDVVFTVGMSMFETVLLGRPLWDINAQPTMFSRRLFESWQTPPDDFALDLYAYYSARRSGMAIERFAVRFGKRLHGQSHWNVNWAAKWKFIRRTVDFSMRLRAGAYR